MKTANFYRNRPSELSKSLLSVIPESPRVPQSGLPSNYDWAMFDEDTNFQFIKNVCNQHENQSRTIFITFIFHCNPWLIFEFTRKLLLLLYKI